MSSQRFNRLPATLLSEFLGSGETTIVNSPLLVSKTGPSGPFFGSRDHTDAPACTIASMDSSNGESLVFR